jgi:hypothetical protein
VLDFALISDSDIEKKGTMLQQLNHVESNIVSGMIGGGSLSLLFRN